jgi:hypothetical protein
MAKATTIEQRDRPEDGERCDPSEFCIPAQIPMQITCPLSESFHQSFPHCFPISLRATITFRERGGRIEHG